MDGLIMSDNLELASITRLSEQRLKRFTMSDLKQVFSSIDETEAKIMVKNIRDHRFDKCAHLIEMVAYRIAQTEVTKKLLERKK